MIRPDFKPRLKKLRGYWRVTPTGVWKLLNEDERIVLKAAHSHAAKLNGKTMEHDRILAEARAMVNRHVELGRAREADRWRQFVIWLRAL